MSTERAFWDWYADLACDKAREPWAQGEGRNEQIGFCRTRSLMKGDALCDFFISYMKTSNDLQGFRMPR